MILAALVLCASIDTDVHQLAAALSSPDPQVRRAAAADLAGIGSETAPVVPQMIAALDDPDRDVHAFLIDAIETTGPVAAAPALPKALEFVRGSDTDLAIRAADLLGTIGERGAVATPDIVRLFRESDDEGVRELLAGVFRKIGPGALAAEPALLDVLDRTPPGSTLALHITVALQNITARSPRAVAAINAMLRDQDAKRGAAERVRAMGGDIAKLIAALRERDAHLRAEVVGELAVKGPSLDGRLLEAMKTQNVYVRAGLAEVLDRRQAHNEEVMAAFRAAIRSGDAALVREVLDSLRGHADQAESLVPAMVEFLETSKDAIARAEVMRFLQVLDPWKHPETLPVLIEALSSDDRYTRGGAAANLALFHDRARSAAPKLIPLLRDRVPEVRENAAKALGAVAAHDPAVIRALAATLSTNDHALQREALVALHQSGPSALPVAPQLREALTHSTGDLRKLLVTTLGVIDPKAQPTMTMLAETLREGDSYAAYQLARNADQTLGTVLETFARSTPQQRSAMAKSVAWIASLAHQAPKDLPTARVIEIVRPALADSDRNIQRVALTVASRLREKAAPLRSDFVARLDDVDVEIRHSALELLILIGADLKSVLSHADPSLRRKAAMALRSRPDGPATLANVAASDSVVARRVAVWALGAPNPHFEICVPALIQALDDRDEEVVRAAAWSLPEWHDRAEPALPALVRKLKSPSHQVRLAAGRAIRRIEHFSTATLVKEHADETLRLLFGDKLRQELELPKLVAKVSPAPAIPKGARFVADLYIHNDGHIIDVMIREGISPSVNATAVATLMRWTFAAPNAIVLKTVTFE